ncbi:hypothetical protein EYF80_054896 [Liparis tanakae]|uniref:Uncharacterized protein n=1 Tax=Liparis tanakae TaxID=230148 RepID=A0A4Z2F155_9TELE|nr:hypothetical protein EYF80_054896 [Liparis tanakae]
MGDSPEGHRGPLCLSRRRGELPPCGPEPYTCLGLDMSPMSLELRRWDGVVHLQAGDLISGSHQPGRTPLLRERRAASADTGKQSTRASLIFNGAARSVARRGVGPGAGCHAAP